MNEINRSQSGAFNDKAFWQEINPILRQGTKDMLLSRRDKEALVAAYDAMDRRINEVVESHSPPEEVLSQLMSKLKDRVRVVGRIMKANNIDPSGYWQTETIGVSRVVLRAIGAPEESLFRVDRVKELAIDAMTMGPFSRDGAERFIDHLGTFECRDLRTLLSKLQDRPSHVDFLRFLQRYGTDSAARAATGTLSMLAPEAKPVKLAKVIAFPTPSRRQAQHI